MLFLSQRYVLWDGKIAMDSLLVKNDSQKGIPLWVFECLLWSLFDVVWIFNSKKIIYNSKYHRKNIAFIPVIPAFNPEKMVKNRYYRNENVPSII